MSMHNILESQQILAHGNSSLAPDDNAYVEVEVPVQRAAKPKRLALSLFSGGGGLDLGVERAGFQTIACLEIDEKCCETLRANQPKFFADAKIINGSVDDIDLGTLMKQTGIKPGELDLLFGGPPPVKHSVRLESWAAPKIPAANFYFPWSNMLAC